MTITDIDKQLSEFAYFLQYHITKRESTEMVFNRVKSMLHQIYSQAKAEQREEDIKIIERRRKEVNIFSSETADRFVDDIINEITSKV